MDKIHESWIPVFEDYEFDLDLLDKPKPTKKDKKKKNDEDVILDIIYPPKELFLKFLKWMLKTSKLFYSVKTLIIILNKLMD